MSADQKWLEVCRDQRIDPEDVRVVFARYESYRKFSAERPGAAMPLEQWFNFYHLEKSSEGQQAGPAPSGCSVDSEAVNDAVISRPGIFLQALIAYREAQL